MKAMYIIYENERNRGKQTSVIYKMITAWLRKYRSILVFMTKEIKDTERETGRKMLGEQLSWNLASKKVIIFY